jgi:hypothetical protein
MNDGVELSHKTNRSWYQGVFVPKNKDKCLNTGKIEYKSSWESKICFLCDNSKQIVRWGYEIITIPYTDYKGKVRNYITDFYVEFLHKDKIIKFIWEVKPQKQGPVFENGRWDTKNKPKPPIKKSRKSLARYQYELKTYSNNMMKWQSMQSYCKSKGYLFTIITEIQLKKLMQKMGTIL